MISSYTELVPSEKQSPFFPLAKNETTSVSANRMNELDVWLRSLRCFFRVYNHSSLFGLNKADLITREWSGELRIARSSLLLCSRFALQLIETKNSDRTIFDEADAESSREPLSSAVGNTRITSEVWSSPFTGLVKALGDTAAFCESLLTSTSISLEQWVNLGDYLEQKLDKLRSSQGGAPVDALRISSNLPEQFLSITQTIAEPVSLGADMLHIFSALFRLLDRLQVVENLLRHDQPLKQTLPIFALVNDEARSLIEFIETRTLRADGLPGLVSEALDSTNYAISMELRKVFASELEGVGAIRNASNIYSRIECAHGLLRNSFQQSVIGLAQVFNPALEGSQLFVNYQIRLEQSLVLRNDLWTLLQLAKRAEKEREHFPLERLTQALAAFRDGSLRFLMYKDWEACERFIEEIGAARGVVRLEQVSHRLAAYLEALFSQINMRAVLANYPFEYPALEN
jgi:hypothetical protein